MVIVRKQDVIAAGFCGPGMGLWCELNGFTSKDIKDGIPADKLLATGCELAERVVAAAIRRTEMEAEDGR